MVNPNTEEGLLMKGLMHKLPVKGEVPDCMLVEPFTEEVVPCNESAVMANLPHPTNGVLMYKKLPGDCDVFKMHMADEKTIKFKTSTAASDHMWGELGAQAATGKDVMWPLTKLC